LPDFLSDAFLRIFGPVERLLERSPLREYSAHYMAVLQKPRVESAITGSERS
jgi:hypothetical protein